MDLSRRISESVENVSITLTDCAARSVRVTTEAREEIGSDML